MHLLLKKQVRVLSYTVGVYVHIYYRLELSGLPSSAVEGADIMTSSNAAYGMTKQRSEPEEGYAQVPMASRGPPPANEEGIYEAPLPLCNPLAAPVAGAGEEERVYETIPVDK